MYELLPISSLPSRRETLRKHTVPEGRRQNVTRILRGVTSIQPSQATAVTYFKVPVIRLNTVGLVETPNISCDKLNPIQADNTPLWTLREILFITNKYSRKAVQRSQNVKITKDELTNHK